MPMDADEQNTEVAGTDPSDDATPDSEKSAFGGKGLWLVGGTLAALFLFGRKSK